MEIEEDSNRRSKRGRRGRGWDDGSERHGRGGKKGKTPCTTPGCTRPGNPRRNGACNQCSAKQHPRGEKRQRTACSTPGCTRPGNPRRDGKCGRCYKESNIKRKMKRIPKHVRLEIFGLIRNSIKDGEHLPLIEVIYLLRNNNNLDKLFGYEIPVQTENFVNFF